MNKHLSNEPGTVGILNVGSGDVHVITAARPWPSDVAIARQPVRDLRGQSFGRLRVLCHLGFSKSAWVTYWICLCSCGAVVAVSQKALARTTASTRSCGCLAADAASQRMWQGCGELSKHYWSALQNHARERGLAFELSMEEGWALFQRQQAMCALSGVEIEFGRYRPEARGNARNGSPRLGTASLDRKDSSRAYVAGNVQWVHKELNRMKGKLSDEQFIQWCAAVAMFWRRSTQHPSWRPEAGL